LLLLAMRLGDEVASNFIFVPPLIVFICSILPRFFKNRI
jgi:hypothetical protein